MNNVNDIKPFYALHYNMEIVKDIGLCFSQPYDVISPQMQDNYYNQHHYNVVRLILNKITPADNEQNNRYTRTKNILEDWKVQGILATTPFPCFWVYEMEFELPGNIKKKVQGFIGNVKLASFEEQKIMPHEKVLKGPVEDRIKLTTSTNTQLEYIWGMYSDKERIIDGYLKQIISKKPKVDHYETDLKVRHKLWPLIDSVMIENIQGIIRERRIYIADGHHRYTTMLAVRDRMRAENPNVKDAPWDYIMMYLTNSEHEGMTIKATHRMVHDLTISNWDGIWNKINHFFYVEKITTPGNTELLKKQWQNKISDTSQYAYRIGFYLKENQFYVLSLKNIEDYKSLYTSAYSSEWMLLDVNILNTLLLNHIFGITEEQLSLNTNVKYTVDVDETVDMVNSGDMMFSFVLNPTRLSDCLAVSDKGEMMPRKSTYFYPKPISGLVMYEMK